MRSIYNADLSKLKQPLDQRLLANSVQTETCWLWQKYISPKGYGYLGIDRSIWSAHRVAYEVWIGPIPDGYEVDHLCRVRHCINPAHLEAVPKRENLRRAAPYIAEANRRRPTPSHCPRGHPYAEHGVRYAAKARNTSAIMCRICHNAKQNARRAARMAERT